MTNEVKHECEINLSFIVCILDQIKEKMNRQKNIAHCIHTPPFIEGILTRIFLLLCMHSTGFGVFYWEK